MDNRTATDKTVIMAAVDTSSLLITNNSPMVQPAHTTVVKEALSPTVNKEVTTQRLLNTNNSPLPQLIHPTRVATR